MDMKARHSTLGSLLRSLRLRNGWTLKEMSERTSIPVSTLSKVEHNNLTLTYDKLVQLSQRLNIRISELFADQTGTPELAVTARRSIGRTDDAVRVNTKNYDYHYLCPELRRKRNDSDLDAHPRQERRGIRRPRASFRRGIHLRIGRARQSAHGILRSRRARARGIHLSRTGNMGHAYVTADGCEEATVIGVCSSPDEGLMESLMSLHGDHTASKSTRPEETSRPAQRSQRARKR